MLTPALNLARLLKPQSQITHPKRIRRSQRLRIHRLGHHIHNGLIRRQITIRRPSETDRPLDKAIHIDLHALPKLILRRDGLVRLREPEDHLVADEEGELLLELVARVVNLGQAAGDGHERAGEEAFRCEGAHEGLQVWGQPERDDFGVVQHGAGGDDCGDEFRAPDVACGAGDAEFVGEA